MTTETAIAPTVPAEIVQPDNVTMSAVLLDAGRFTQLWKAAQMFAGSALVPAHLQGKPGDCAIALALAWELRENPLTVMQSIYIVSGKAGWNATYIIAKANASGVFRGPIRWRETGSGDSLAVTAFASLADTDEIVEYEVSMATARDEGWTRNSKYKTMPKLMLRYRSATALVRLYCPQVLLGFRTADELEDIDTDGRARTPFRRHDSAAIPQEPIVEPQVDEAATLRANEAARKRAADERDTLKTQIEEMEKRLTEDERTAARKARGLYLGPISSARAENATLSAYADDLDRLLSEREAGTFAGADPDRRD